MSVHVCSENIIIVCLDSLIHFSLGEPVELSSKFIRYSTFRTGKEQLVKLMNVT